MGMYPNLEYTKKNNSDLLTNARNPHNLPSAERVYTAAYFNQPEKALLKTKINDTAFDQSLAPIVKSTAHGTLFLFPAAAAKGVGAAAYYCIFNPVSCNAGGVALVDAGSGLATGAVAPGVVIPIVYATNTVTTTGTIGKINLFNVTNDARKPYSGTLRFANNVPEALSPSSGVNSTVESFGGVFTRGKNITDVPIAEKVSPFAPGAEWGKTGMNDSTWTVAKITHDASELTPGTKTVVSQGNNTNIPGLTNYGRASHTATENMPYKAHVDTSSVTGGMKSLGNMDDMIGGYPISISFSTNLKNHLANVDGFKQSVGIKGGHNMNNFLSELSARNGIVVSKNPIADGVFEIKYKIPRLDRTGRPDGSYKIIKDPKTVYDPAKFSDEQMLKMAQEAAAKGYVKNRAKNVTQYTEIINDIKFRVYLDKKGVVINVHPGQ